MMKNVWSVTGRCVVLGLLALASVGCGGSAGDAGTPPVSPAPNPPTPTPTPAPAPTPPPPPSVFGVTSPTVNAYVNTATVSALQVTGTCDSNASGISITGAATATAVCVSGQWTVSLNLSSAAEGSIILNATESVTSGVAPAMVSVTLTKDTVIPSVVFQSPAMNASIAPVNVATLSVRGTCTESATAVALSGAVSTSATCSNGAWSTTVNLSGSADGALTLNAQQSDAAGNSSTQTLNVTKATACSATQLTQLETEIIATLTSTTTDADFSFDVKTEDGRELTYNRGASTMTTPYQSASTSKWVSATVMLSFMESSANQNSTQPLTLNSRPQDFIDPTIWPVAPTDPLASITLRQLLSFTSGLSNEPGCITPGEDISFAACVAAVASANIGNGKTPGAEFFYGGSHLQVAGMMVINARNKALNITTSTWQDLFSEFKTKTGLFNTSQYNLPTLTNPRLAGGMTWLGTEYLRFIEAVYKKQVLSNSPVAGQTLSFHQQQFSDQLASAVVGNSPVLLGTGEDWHYGFGVWAECHAPSYNCINGVESYSSPGAYGAYPFMNSGNKFYGIIARQGTLFTFRRGYALYGTVESKVTQWANRSCP